MSPRRAAAALAVAPGRGTERGRAGAPAPAGDGGHGAAVAEFSFQLLRQDGVLAHFRGRHARDGQTLLMTLAASEAVAAPAAAQLNHEFSLRERLSPAWAVAPIARIWQHGSLALLYDDGAAEPLDQRRARAVDVDSFLSLALGMAHALRGAHEAGLVHNNLKPAHILVDAAGACRLAGFGLATLAQDDPAPAPVQGGARISGTPAYMSPEHSGRTGHAPDARSDLYALGVVFYELLSGRLPFALADASPAGDWIHAHLASEPLAPDDGAPEVPAMLAQLVLKLLAKRPEQRYQSAAGLEADLKRCRLAWQADGAIADFVLGQRDRAAALVFPERLYGREAELRALIAAYDAVVATGRHTLAVVSGPSGAGKSSLLQSLLGHPLLQRAWLAVAKVDRQRRDAPYAALAGALRALVLCILGQHDAELRHWQRRLLDGLGRQAGLAVAMVPELEMLIGRQPMATDGAGAGAATDAERRAVVLRLLRLFAVAERPLVLMVDDVQWLDLASMDVLEQLVGAERALPLLLLVTCRDSDLDGEPVLTRSLSLLRAHTARFHDVRLAMFDAATLQRWLADTLRTGRRQVGALAGVVLEKTAGNPHFVRQFIKRCVDEGWLQRSTREGKWRWQLEAIGALPYAANVGQLLLQRQAGLARQTQLLLGGLAGLDAQGDSVMLGVIHGLARHELDAALLPALQARVIAARRDAGAEAGAARLEFTHALLREAAYAALSETERHQLHFSAAQIYAALADLAEQAQQGQQAPQGQQAQPQPQAPQTDPVHQASQAGETGHGGLADARAREQAALFQAVGHLAQLRTPMRTLLDYAQRLRYAGLALRAARLARRVIAAPDGQTRPGGPSAQDCLAVARALLDGAAAAAAGGAAGPAAPAAALLGFEVALEQATLDFAHSRLAPSASMVAQLLAFEGECRLALRARVWLLQAELQVHAGAYPAALATARLGLAAFGIDMPLAPAAREADALYYALQLRLGGDAPARLLALPQLADPDAAAAMALLTVTLVPASFTDTNLHFLQLCRTLLFTLEHGMTAVAAGALGWFGVLLGQRHGQYASGYAYAQLGRELVVAHGYDAAVPAALMALDQVAVWTEPLAYSIECARAALAAALVQGDNLQAGYAHCHQVCNLLVRGDHLDAVADALRQGLAFVGAIGLPHAEQILQVQRGYVEHLRRTPGTPGPGVELPGLETAAGAPLATLQFWRWLYLAILHYLDGEIGHASDCLERAGELAWSAPGNVHQLDYHLFSVLTLGAAAALEAAAGPLAASTELAAAADAITATPGVASATPGMAAATLAETADMATTAPGPAREAARRGARRARMAGHAAQIAVWAALNPATFADKHALAQAELLRLDGDALAALTHYETAVAHAEAHGYDQYGGLAHAAAARLCRGAGLATAAAAHARGARDAYRRWGALRLAAQLEQAWPQLARATDGGRQDTVSLAASAELRDIDSVIRSARALSEEIVPDRLVQTLLKIALEHAGAQRGLLIRLHAGVPVIEARARTTPAGIAVQLIQAAPGPGELPTTMLYMALRTRQYVSVGAGPRPAPFSGDPYLQRYPRCAAICLPMLKQSQLVGLLYLEHQLAPHPFSAEHAEVLVLLAAQAAVSLETARLYAELLAENAQRREIERALRESKATLLLGEEISHSGSWRWDMRAGLMHCSAEFCRIFGFDPARPAVAFGAFMDAVHGDDRERVRRHVHSRVAERRTIRVEFRAVRPDGALRYLSCVGKPVAADIATDTYVGTASDITLRRAADDTLRAAQADLARVARVTTVGQLTASIAHEVNQPLMSIASNAGASLRWLERDPPQLDQVRSGLQDIASQSRRAGDMIQSLQALTRNAPAELAPVDLHHTIRHILAISRNEIERSGVALELALQAPAHWVMGDPVQLQQVMLNMVINAIEAMSATPAARVLTISSAAHQGGRIAIAVADTGVGLDADAAGRIFEAFYTTKPHGMGMGLAICRSIIEAHHGVVTARARQPRGCSFDFVLPVLAA